MPEGHTVHRIAQDHSANFSGNRLRVSSPQGRFETGAKVLDNRFLESVEAYGKHLCYRWSGSKLMHIHLGLYGKFRLHRVPAPEPRGQVRLRVVGNSKAFDLNGPTVCEVITAKQWLAIQNRLGEDPLRSDADFEKVCQRIISSRAAVGTLLLNQSVIAGVGNIYRSEVLHLLKINPNTPGNRLSEEQVRSLWKMLTELLQVGVRYNRIIIADPKEVGKPRSRMTKEERLFIYKKVNCLRCDGAVSSWILGARKVFACLRCQPEVR